MSKSDFARAREILREDGLMGLLGGINRRLIIITKGIIDGEVWRLIPKKNQPGNYNGVLVPFTSKRYFDSVLSYDDSSIRPNFKHESAESLRTYVEENDHILTIGGGRGITATIAANQTGDEGKVDVYEPDEDRVATIRETLELNEVLDVCDVHHAMVGPVHRLGKTPIETEKSQRNQMNAKKITPNQLPDCDVIEMDCEGTEKAILEDLQIQPRVLIIETHQNKEFASYQSVEEIKTELDDMGYSVVTKENKNRVKVLIGIDD